MFQIKPGGVLSESMQKLRGEAGRLVEFAVNKGEQAFDALSHRGESFEPVVDVLETPEFVLVLAEIPGIDPNLVEISLAGSTLTISGSKLPTPLQDDVKLHIGERESGKFSRDIPLPVAVKPDAVHAESREGLLQIRLGKTDPTPKHTIKVTPSESTP
ncbi:MAG: Hsp20/alpha crystallin family protein [Planctomycetota bacterium]|nr:Hsp20/alpha crystallin family protein [Planctomycetota bacterium]